MKNENRWPSEEELKKVRKKLARVKGSYGLPPDATALDKAKYKMCERFLIYMREADLTQRELSKKIGVPETRVSEIVHYRIWKFTLDRLIEYYEKLDPKVDLKFA